MTNEYLWKGDRLCSDSVFIRASRELALAGLEGQPDSYLYVFERNPNDPSNRASHIMEVPYVFNNLPAQASREDKELAKLINDYWVQFAKTGLQINQVCQLGQHMI